MYATLRCKTTKRGVFYSLKFNFLSMKNIIGLNIKYLRKIKKMNQGEVGALLGGKSPQVVGKYERGDSLPPLDVIYQLAEIFEVSSGDLISVDLSKEGGGKQSKPTKKEDDVIEVKPLIQALKESQERYKKLEAEVLKNKKLAKKLGLE